VKGEEQSCYRQVGIYDTGFPVLGTLETFLLLGITEPQIDDFPGISVFRIRIAAGNGH
jgi:hypothetical protein